MTDVKEQLRAYFDEVDPPFDPAGLIREPQTPFALTRGPVGSGVLTAGVAAIVVVVAVALPLLFLTNPSPTAVEPSATTTAAPTTTATTTEPTTLTSTTAAQDQVNGNPLKAPTDVFSWSEDDISDWVTEDEMAAALDDLSIEYAGTRLDGDVEFESTGFVGVVPAAVVWTVGSTDRGNRWEVRIHNGSHVPDDLWLHDTEFTLPQGEITTGGWGVFTVRGPNSDESLCIWVGAPEEILGTYVQQDIYVEMVSELASMVMEELGWVG